MADDLFNQESFDEGLAVSRRQPVNFAFALGKKKEESVLGFHRRKPGEELARKAKKEDGATSKTAYGTATTEGKLITLTCEEYLPGIKKALKLTFKSRGLQLKVNIVAPEGVELDPEDAEQDYDGDEPGGDSEDAAESSGDVESETAESSSEAQAEEAPSLADVIEELKRLAPRVAALAKTQREAAQPLIAIVNEIKQSVSSQDAAAAEAGLERLREGLQNASAAPPPPPPAASPLKQQLLQSLPKITPAVGRLLNSPDVGDEVKQRLRGLVDQLKALIRSEDLQQAKATVGQIAQLVKQHRPTEGTDGGDGKDETAQLTAALMKLKQTVVQVLADQPDRKGELAASLAAIAGDIKSKRFDEARTGLTALGQLVQGLRAGGREPSGEETTGADQQTQRWREARAAWQTAAETVDEQINRLQAACKKSGDTNLERLAEFGLAAVTRTIKTPFTAALLEFDKASPADRPRFADKLLDAVVKYREFVEQDEAVQLFDENPFDVEVAIRTTLSPPLARMAEIVASIAGEKA